MSLYLHIPFCQQACHYCNFHFSTTTRLEKPLIKAMCQELRQRKDYIDQPLRTIYLGGGTPSLLQSTSLVALFDTIHKLFVVAPNASITLEANPEDITLERLQLLKTLGINRLSMGIQSFQDVVLRSLNRAHTAQKAMDALRLIQKSDLKSYSIDLIYGIPASSQDLWAKDVATALTFAPPHLAAYCLTIEPHTTFGNWHRKGKLVPVSDHAIKKQFDFAVDQCTKAGYAHYEISNFAQQGHYAQHNINYWKRGSYLGIGPGAHSYNGVSRQWNIAHNARYIRALQSGKIPYQREMLTPKQHIIEYIMTSLRTQSGCDTAWLKAQYQYDLKQQAKVPIAMYVRKGLLQTVGNVLLLTHEGKWVADHIIVDLLPA